ncbi:unnamed protein product [Candidula unifasciata]|uniref:G-protein coupled receptors family 1 profile domain-containing protein n=1 Tax=Candidula unifasciata TaxID=100452 RepID=A0A8S4A3G5_9EUPU|nr:unnamed protein product [Candidula unifasciata]
MKSNISVTTLACAGKCLDTTVKIISDNVLIYFRTSVSIVLSILVSVVGVIANVFNIIVYYKQGFKDSVNITFMALSVWDLAICFLSGVTAVLFVIEVYFPIPNYNVGSIGFVYVAYTRALMYILSTLTTVYLSCERCLCVLTPLKIKDIFTRPRTILVNVAIIMLGVASISPAWATQRTHWLFNPTNNITQLVLWLSANRRDIDLFIGTLTGMLSPIAAQVIITISSGFMIHGINKSSKFRNTTNLERSRKTYNSKNESKIAGTTFHKTMNMMTNNELKLTIVVVLLTIIFFVCNLPLVMNVFVRVFFPEVDIGKPQENLYELLYSLVFQCVLVKSTVNIFVYYYASSRYRRDFLSLYC